MPWLRADQMRIRLSVERRSFSAAKVTDLTASMVRAARPPDGDIRRAINILRARSRQEFQSNDYAKNAVRLFKQNIIGADGIRYQSAAVYQSGLPDRPARNALEEGWKAFCKKGVPEVTRRHSWKDCLDLIVQSLVVDGEAILVGFPGTTRNRFGFAFELVDPVLLDHELNEDLKNGNVIRMGVELDSFNAPVAYYFLEHDPLKDDYAKATFRKSHRVVPADRVVHLFLPEYVIQTRGVPWMSTALLRSNMLQGYEEAEVVAARAAAAKMGFFEEAEDGAEYTGDAQDADGATEYMEASEAGVFGRIPHGAKFHQWDPSHPTQQYPFFVKAMLRGMAAGIGVPYNSLASDLEGVNFSSLRQGNLDAKDTWRTLQTMLIESVCDWVYENWLSNSLLLGSVEIRPGAALSPAFRQKYMRVHWQPRSWEHVQPREQEQANLMRLGMRTTTISELIRERGRDPDEVYDQWAEDIQKLKERGIPLPKELIPDEQTEPEEQNAASGQEDGGDHVDEDDGDPEPERGLIIIP